MTRPIRRALELALFCLPMLLSASLVTAADELAVNGDFSQLDARGLPSAWSLSLPEVEEAQCSVRGAPGGLLMEAAGRAYAVGGVRQDLRGVRGGEAYAIRATCKAQGLPHAYRALLVRLTWTQAGRELHPAGAYIRGPIAGPGQPSATSELTFQDVLVAPERADGATLRLELKWPQGGSVLWQRVSVQPASPPPSRKVKIGTVYLRPRASTPERNRELFSAQIDAAGKLGLDIVCLPEAITAIGARASGPQLAETIPGPSTERLGTAAKRNRIWVVAGLYERGGRVAYNTAVLLDREGRIAGKYRKVHLPREEWRLGFTPGSEYPVFKTDFGTVAIQICYDYFFPEPAELLAMKGAEIVFAPTWGTTFADRDGRVEGENIFRVRARDNGIYLVPSVYDGSSMVIDPLGRVLASSRGQEGVFWCEVDLNAREPLEWVGHWRGIGQRDRMPSTYQALTRDPEGPAY